jgi:hypothetical protein
MGKRKLSQSEKRLRERRKEIIRETFMELIEAVTGKEDESAELLMSRGAIYQLPGHGWLRDGLIRECRKHPDTLVFVSDAILTHELVRAVAMPYTWISALPGAGRAFAVVSTAYIHGFVGDMMIAHIESIRTGLSVRQSARIKKCGLSGDTKALVADRQDLEAETMLSSTQLRKLVNQGKGRHQKLNAIKAEAAAWMEAQRESKKG